MTSVFFFLFSRLKKHQISTSFHFSPLSKWLSERVLWGGEKMEWHNDSISVSADDTSEDADGAGSSSGSASVSVFDALSMSASFSSSASGFGDSSVFAWLAEGTPDTSAEQSPSPSSSSSSFRSSASSAAAAAAATEDVARTAFWEVSSAKPGFGADRLRDSSTDAYWQSDSVGPHAISIHFRSRTLVTVCFSSLSPLSPLI